MIVKIQQTENTDISSWEISNIVSSLSCYDYKTKLLDNMTSAFSDNIDLGKLIIFDKSFEVNKRYTNLGVININSIEGVLSIYAMGKPRSLFFNYKYDEMNLLFRYYDKCRSELYKSRTRVYTKNDMARVVIADMSVREKVRLIKDQISDQVNDYEHEQNELGETLDHTNLLERISLIEDEFLNEASQFEGLEIARKGYEECILEGVEYREMTGPQQDYFTNRFVGFFKFFDQMARPVLALERNDNRTLDILKLNHINRNMRDDDVFKVTEMQHNSPVALAISAGISLGILLKYYFESRKLAKEFELLEAENADLASTERERFDSMLQYLTDNNVDSINTLINSIENQHLKQQIKNSYNSNVDKGRKILRRYKLDNRSVTLETAVE